MDKYKSIIFLGEKDNSNVWLYLCGLTSDWDSLQELKNREILGRIASREGIKIIAIKPFSRCDKFENKLCWPHFSPEMVRNTYRKIKLILPADIEISGFIGFSNGGFFLNQLGQETSIDQPIISIGSGGYFDENNSGRSNIHLVVGTQDKYHYMNAINFYKKSKKHKDITVDIVVHEGGHEIPEDIVCSLIHNLKIQ